MTSTPLEWHLGQSFYYQGNHVKAFDHYKKAALQNPFHMQVLNDLGALYEEKGDHVSAMNCFDRVFAMNPDFPDARMNLVAVYFNTGETEKAFDILKNHPYKYSENGMLI
ncbi:MAG: tetratricopeptide repeat protein [Bacteroidetes bacterium]|nr:tetratricopeptide repeat protein [Bacteroidota bacterium]